jgi:hypothetical protein
MAINVNITEEQMDEFLNSSEVKEVLNWIFEINGGGNVMEDKLVNGIYETTNYDKFKLIESNRDFEVRQNLADDLKEFGSFEYPIEVNEKMEVIDGQHRLATAKYLKVPIQYFVKEGADKKTVIRINTKSVNWKITDYIKSYATEGIEDYQILLRNLENPKAACLTPTSIMGFSSGVGSAPSHAKIRNGKFKIIDQWKLDKFIDFMYSLSEKTNTKSFKDKAGKAIYDIWNHPKVDKKRLFRVLSKPNVLEFIDVTFDKNYLIPTILDEYNKRLSVENRIDVHYDNEKNVVIEK